MKRQPEDLYLDIMKKALAFALWPEPPIPINIICSMLPPLKRLPVSFASLLFSFVSRFLGSKRLQLAIERRDITPNRREEGKCWPAYADTMIGLRRLDNIQFCIETVIRENVDGDLIETGVWRGGACIFMRAVLAAYGIEDRKVYVADSFEGLPRPDAERFPADKDDKFHAVRFLAVSQHDVENNFSKYGLLDEQVVFLKGWFRDTLPNAPIQKLAVMRLDGDMYASTMDALTNLYPKLSEGGFCIIDDYNLPGCRKAVDDFRTQNGIYAELQVVDWAARHWRKELRTPNKLLKPTPLSLRG